MSLTALSRLVARRRPGNWFVALLLVPALLGTLPARAQDKDALVVEAREALRKKDLGALAAARKAVVGHPLAQWVDYWELSNRLDSASAGEVETFYARWPDTYVEDRLRNDWLLELGKRRDWDNLVRDYPRFRMNDDREVSCYALYTRHLAGNDVRAEARSAPGSSSAMPTMAARCWPTRCSRPGRSAPQRSGRRCGCR